MAQNVKDGPMWHHRARRELTITSLIALLFFGVLEKNGE